MEISQDKTKADTLDAHVNWNHNQNDNKSPVLESVFSMRTRSKIENELNRNKVQFDENRVQFVRKHKFRSMKI